MGYTNKLALTDAVLEGEIHAAKKSGDTCRVLLLLKQQKKVWEKLVTLAESGQGRQPGKVSVSVKN